MENSFMIDSHFLNKQIAILKDIYKYYPTVHETFENNKDKIFYKHYPMIYETTYSDKDKLRMKKINSKKFHKNKLRKDIARILKGYAVIDWVEDSACCYEYRVLLHKNIDIMDDDIMLMEKLHGERNDLNIYISVLEPYYYLEVLKTTYTEKDSEWKFFTMKEYSIQYIELMNKIDRYFYKKGYRKLTDAETLIPVPDVETIYKDVNKVNVFHCLFMDL